MNHERVIAILEELEVAFLQQSNEAPLNSRESKLAGERYEAIKWALWLVRAVGGKE